MIKLMKSRHLAFATLAVAVLATGGVVAQDDGDAAADLAPLEFTAAQAVGGGANYQRSCASCHGTELEGVAGPALSGANFSWRGRPVAEFHGYIQELMPADAPGSLSDAQVSTIIAFIAQHNDMVAGDVAMPTDPADLEGIAFGQ